MTDVCASCGNPATRTHAGKRLCRWCYESAVPSWRRPQEDEAEEEEAAPETAEASAPGALPAPVEPARVVVQNTEAAFEALVLRLQEAAAADPYRYRMRVLLLAMLGYGFLIGSVVVMGIATVVIVVIFAALRIALFSRTLIAPLLTRMNMVSRALWVRIPIPDGTPLTAEQAPALFSRIEEVRRDAHGPRIHCVLLDANFNAAIVQVPRLGVLGWQENYLVLGLPLLQFLPTEEFKAVLAHEMGHLVGAHGRFGVWMYRQRRSWLSLLERLEAEKKLEGSVFLSFSRWYAPLFNAHTFVMARAHEYHADQLSARVTSPEVAADALSRMQLGSRWIAQEFWPDIQLRLRTTPDPPTALFNEMARRGREQDADRATAGLAEAAATTTGSLDTHPSFADRLEALGQGPRVPAPFDVSAAEDLLGPALPELQGKFNRDWFAGVVEAWKHAHAQATLQRTRLEELDAREAAASLELGDRWERACLLKVEGHTAEAEAIVEDLVTTTPTFPPAQSAWGIILLQRGDEAGLAHVERALEHGGIDPGPPCEAAYAFLRARNRAAEAERFAKRIREYQKLLATAQAEQETIEVKDLEGHGLPEATLQELREVLVGLPRIRTAYLARKRGRDPADPPSFVLGVELTGPRDTHAEEVGRLVGHVTLPGSWAFVVLARAPWRFRSGFKRVAGGAFYQAPPSRGAT